MTGNPIREALIREIKAILLDGTAAADPADTSLGARVSRTHASYRASAIVDALGLVTDRKLRILTEDGFRFHAHGNGGWSWWVPDDMAGYWPTLAGAVDAAWNARET